MDMSAAEVRRAATLDGRAAAASSTPHATAPEPNGSEILVRCLQAEGVKFLWGYPGGAVLYIYDALYKQDTIEHVLVRHEQAAVHAADGYARATGEVGVAHQHMLDGVLLVQGVIDVKHRAAGVAPEEFHSFGLQASNEDFRTIGLGGGGVGGRRSSGCSTVNGRGTLDFSGRHIHF